MFTVTLYVSKPTVMSYTHYQERDKIEKSLIEYFGGYTRIENATGVWLNSDGVIVVDDVDKYEILTFHTRKAIHEGMEDIISLFKYAYDQECLPYSIVESDNTFI